MNGEMKVVDREDFVEGENLRVRLGAEARQLAVDDSRIPVAGEKWEAIVTASIVFETQRE